MNPIRITLRSLVAVVLLFLAACQQTPLPQATPELGAELSTQAVTPGTVVVWGRNGNEQVSMPAGLNDVTAIAAGDYHSLALKNDGTVVAWGSNGHEQVTIPAGLSNVSAIAAGDLHSLTLKRDGSVVGWGSNSDGQLNIPPGFNISAIAVGGFHSLALKRDTAAPSVKVEQAADQADPTTADAIQFTATFSEPVNGFASEDISLAGTAGATTATVSNGSSPTTYTVTVTGMTQSGTVIASLAPGVATDIAGNGNTASTSNDNTVTYTAPVVDSTAPFITPSVAGTLGNNDWYTSDVTISWTVTDDESALLNQTGCEAATVTTDTAGVTFTCEATSSGGTTTQSVSVKRDTTLPTIAFVSRTPANANGWNNSDVTLDWTCTDATSGVVAASVAQTLRGEGANQALTGTCTDNAGLSASDTQTGINLDKTAPTLTPSSHPIQSF
jgi:hypothetical protein